MWPNIGLRSLARKLQQPIRKEEGDEEGVIEDEGAEDEGAEEQDTQEALVAYESDDAETVPVRDDALDSLLEQGLVRSLGIRCGSPPPPSAYCPATFPVQPAAAARIFFDPGGAFR